MGCIIINKEILYKLPFQTPPPGFWSPSLSITGLSHEVGEIGFCPILTPPAYKHYDLASIRRSFLSNSNSSKIKKDINVLYDVIVVGGGIIGASSAFELAKKGLKVLIVDKQSTGMGASGNSAAMLECQVETQRGDHFLSLAVPSLRLFPLLHKEIRDLTGIDFQYEPCGILSLALDEGQAHSLKKEVGQQPEMGLSAHWIEADLLRKDVPQLDPEHFGGAFYEQDGQVNGEKFLAAMMLAAKKLGVRSLEHTEVIGFSSESDRVVGIQTNRGTFHAENFVVASGAWSDLVLKSLNITLGLQPLRGQLVVYDTPKRILDHPLITHDHGYVVPKKDGYTFVGTTVESVGFDESTSTEAKERLTLRARKILPAFSRLDVRGMTAGIRPGTFDTFPFLGAHPDFNNIFMATGHYRNGILLAPITAKIVTSLILGYKPPVPLDPFSPTRNLVMNAV
ncbi:glycine oxidase ThiO [bacterium F11]|nr:glycine oxidase ThiO [bacterium F11]